MQGSATPVPPSGKLQILGPSQDIQRHRLDEASLSKVLSDKLGDVMSHLERLKQRVSEKSSRILVTGDVNAGKSTFVNALLGADVLPSDQQPCTQSFCEVIPSQRIGMPVVHAMKEIDSLAPSAEKGHLEMSVEEMQEAIQDEESGFSWYRLYWPVRGEGASKRFTAGSTFDISLIDSPGLNSDLFKTTALFSKQADIDVVVFVVNAANHLTLSAREFLERAGKEKDYIFLVVNRFDDIKNQDKCRRIILQQISEVLPLTFGEAEELIHFVSAGAYLGRLKRGADFEDQAFGRLEASLRAFILEKRTRSKLLPAYTFIQRLLQDLDLILADNCARLQQDCERMQTELEMISPCYEDLVAHDLPLRNAVQATINETCRLSYEGCLQLTGSLGACEQQAVPWPGLLGVFRFRRQVLDQLGRAAQAAVAAASGRAAAAAAQGLHTLHALAAAHAPQVFGGAADGWPAGEDRLRGRFVLHAEAPALPDLAAWDLVSLGDELLSTRTWIGAGTIAAALAGYRPLVALGVSLAELLVSAHRPGRARLGLLLAAGGALAVGVLVLDVERMVRRRLAAHARECLLGPWQREHARLLEVATREVLLEASLGLVARFEEALHQQRRLRSEKDMELRQCESVLAHFHTRRDALLGLKAAVFAYKVVV